MFKSKPFKIIAKIIKYICILFAVVMLCIIAVQKLSDNKSNLFGYGVYTIITKSMEPVYDVGDMLFAKKVPFNELEVGNDIVYQGKEGDFKDKVVTHRIIKISGKKIQTQGINNTAPDPEITYDQVIGRVVFKFTVLSVFSKLMNDSILFYFIIFIPFSVILFFDIVGMINDKKQLEEDTEEDNEEKKDKKKINFVEDFDDDDEE